MKSWQILFFALPVLLVAVDSINGAKILDRLQKHWPAIWGDIGPVKLTDSNLSKNRLMLARFIWTFSFLQVDDLRLKLHCLGATAIQLALAGCFISALMLV